MTTLAAPIAVLNTYPLDGPQRARLREVSTRLRFIDREIDDQQTMDAFDGSGVEVIFGDLVPSDLPAWPRLRWLQYSGAGVDLLTEQAPWTSGITVTTASGGNAIAIGEYVLAWLLHLSQQVGDLLENFDRRAWATSRMSLGGHALRGRTLAIVGYGSIGREVARLASAFGVRVLAVKANPSVLEDRGFRVPGTGDPEGAIPEQVVGFDRLGEVVAAADYVLVSAPLTPATRHTMGQAILAAIRSHTWLINVSRGDIFDEAGLIAAGREGRFGRAILDVASHEPLDADDPLWSTPNIVVTPHVAGLSSSTWASLTELFVQNLGRYVAGEPLLNTVDPRGGY